MKRKFESDEQRDWWFEAARDTAAEEGAGPPFKPWNQLLPRNRFERRRLLSINGWSARIPSWIETLSILAVMSVDPKARRRRVA